MWNGTSTRYGKVESAKTLRSAAPAFGGGGRSFFKTKGRPPSAASSLDYEYKSECLLVPQSCTKPSLKPDDLLVVLLSRGSSASRPRSRL